MKSLRTHKEVIADWAPELAAHLSRPESDIRARGLSAYDFAPGAVVEIREPFGLLYRINFAFALVRTSIGQAAVFSEHAGYMEFALEEGTVVAQITESLYCHSTDQPEGEL